MKKTLMILALTVTGTLAQATLQPILYYSQSFSSGSSIGAISTDGSAALGFTGNFTHAGVQDQVVNLTLDLNISGGYNGDLYGYLLAPNGTYTIFRNTYVANGDAYGAGMNIRLQDADLGVATGLATTALLSPNSSTTLNGSIQDVALGGILNGIYTPLNTFGGTIGGPQFNPTGSQANGIWTLYLTEIGAGDESAPTLTGWSLNLAVVPEPVSLALGLFAAMLVALTGVKRFWVAKETAIKPGT